MMKLLKNKEVRKALLWQLLISAAACAVCFFFDVRAGLTAVVLSLLLMLIFCISTYEVLSRHIPPDPHAADLDKSAGGTAVGHRSDR